MVHELILGHTSNLESYLGHALAGTFAGVNLQGIFSRKNSRVKRTAKTLGTVLAAAGAWEIYHHLQGNSDALDSALDSLSGLGGAVFGLSLFEYLLSSYRLRQYHRKQI